MPNTKSLPYKAINTKSLQAGDVVMIEVATGLLYKTYPAVVSLSFPSACEVNMFNGWIQVPPTLPGGVCNRRVLHCLTKSQYETLVAYVEESRTLFMVGLKGATMVRPEWESSYMPARRDGSHPSEWGPGETLYLGRK